MLKETVFLLILQFSLFNTNIFQLYCIYYKSIESYILSFLKDGNAAVQEEKRLSNDVQRENEAVKLVG